MDYKSFGLLIMMLRREFRNDFDQVMTQQELASIANVSVVTLQKMEQGRMARMDPDAVLNIAKALNLPVQARQELLSVSQGLTDSDYIKHPSETADVFPALVESMTNLQTPAFIADTYGDVLACGQAFLELTGLPVKKMNELPLYSRHNLIRWLCAPEFNQRTLLGHGYAQYIHQVIMMYKLNSLSVRSTPYFQQILPELNRLPLFRKEWQAPFIQQDEPMKMMLTVSVVHPEHGVMNFMCMPHATFAGQGRLYLVNFVAMDGRTGKACQKLVERVGNQAVYLSPWPKPLMGWDGPVDLPSGRASRVSMYPPAVNVMASD